MLLIIYGYVHSLLSSFSYSFLPFRLYQPIMHRFARSIVWVCTYASSVFHFIFKCLPTLSLSITIEGLYVVVVLSFIIAKSFLVNTALQHNSNVPLRHFSIDRRYRGWFVQRSYSKFSISSNRECFAPNYCPSAQNSFREN